MGRQRTHHHHLPYNHQQSSQPAPRRRGKPQNPWVMPWILQRQEKGCYTNLLAELIHTAIPGYQNFVRMHLEFFTSSRNAFTTASRSHHQFQEATGSWTQTGHNPETHGHWRDQHILAVPQVGWPHHHLQIHPPGLPDESKRVEKFRTK